MYLIDTNIISELRKGKKANLGVQEFFKKLESNDTAAYISVITIGELQRGVSLIEHRGDTKQAVQLNHWINSILEVYSERTLNFTIVEAQVWGNLRVPYYENAIDKQIAATALTYGLTLVTRNIKDFKKLGLPLLNPFTQ